MKQQVNLTKKFSLKIALLCILSCYLPAVYANIKHAPYPGGIAVIALPHTTTTPPKITYLGNRVLTIKTHKANNKISWLAIVGIPLVAKPGKHQIQLHNTTTPTKLYFQVHDKAYQTQRLNFKGFKPAKHKSKFLIALERKIMHEIKEIETTYKHFNNQNEIANLQLTAPVKGRISSGFGVRRILNGMPKNPHSGLDIAALAGTPVKAPKAGIVIKTKHYYLPGNSVFIDHGHGFITSYFHLQKIAVKVGKHIKPGDIIGYVGKTGRATGPHLHWSVSLNGARVDPQLFLANK